MEKYVFLLKKLKANTTLVGFVDLSGHVRTKTKLSCDIVPLKIVATVERIFFGVVSLGPPLIPPACVKIKDIRKKRRVL
jgi:hypothetical protein